MSKKSKIILQCNKLDPRIVEDLQACTNPRESDLESFKAVDYPRIPDHIYYEQYFHGMDNPSPFQSLNPRYGFPFAKPAGPIALRALAKSFREKNLPAIRQHLLSRLEQGDPLASLIEAGQIFADIALQHHYGDEISNGDIGYHTDATNSLLHLAVSIRGKRVLHAIHQGELDIQHQPEHHFDYSTEESEDPVSSRHPEPAIHAQLQQEAGDVYISSPALFIHGVEYPQSDAWKDRITAAQIRIIYNQQQHMDMTMKARFRNFYEPIIQQMFESMTFQLPTYQEYQDAYHFLESLPTPAPQSEKKSWFSKLFNR